MSVNRIFRHRRQESASPSVAVAAPQSFVVCSGFQAVGPASPGWTWQQEVFRIAYEAARANRAAASDYRNRLFSNWN
jgi:hypothetical protein